MLDVRLKSSIEAGFLFLSIAAALILTLVPQAVVASNDNDSEINLFLDLYYTSFGYYLPVTSAPAKEIKEFSELQVYKELLKKYKDPNYIVIEASINPMPILGVFFKKNTPSFYEKFDIGENTNLIRSLTAGFDEPYALSLFWGNVVSFSAPESQAETANKGYLGYLLSIGDSHIKDNELINDNWLELEWKIKGDRDYNNQKLSWSLRFGTKLHEHPEITDVFYAAIRRSRINRSKLAISSWLENTAVDYEMELSLRDFSPVRHNFYIQKIFPIKEANYSFSIDIGFIWDTASRYSGNLKAIDDKESFELILRPNIKF